MTSADSSPVSVNRALTCTPRMPANRLASGEPWGSASLPCGRQNEPVAEPTGITQIQKAHDMWAKIVAAEEEKAKADVDQVTVEQAVDGCEKLIKVLQNSIKADAKSSARFKHATMRDSLARLRRQGDVLLREEQEIQTILRDAANDVAPIPSGFTRAELEDNLADVKEARRKHGGRLKTHIETMVELEKALQSGKAADGLQALAWYREGRIDRIIEYCTKDVEVTRRLYEYALENGQLLYDSRAGIKTVVLDWAAQAPPPAASEQMSLFEG